MRLSLPTAPVKVAIRLGPAQDIPKAVVTLKGYSHSKCMRCDAPPELDIQWADGRGRAWVCSKCFMPMAKHAGDAFELRQVWLVEDGQVPNKLADGYDRPSPSTTSPKKAMKWLATLKEHTGAMVAFHIPTSALADELSVGGVPADELHMTLLYMGEVLNIPDVPGLMADFADLAKRIGPISGWIAGIGRFTASDTSGNKDVLYASVDAAELPELRHHLWSIAKGDGVDVPDDHGFSPHITLAYVEPGADIPENVQAIREHPVTFDRMYVHLGDDIQWFPLTGGEPKIVLKGGPGSGWFAPGKGTHTGKKHRAVGSGKAGGPSKKKAKVVTKPKAEHVGREVEVMVMSEPSKAGHSVMERKYGTVVEREEDGGYKVRLADGTVVSKHPDDVTLLSETKIGDERDFGERWPHQGPNQWGDEQYKGWRDGLTDREDAAIPFYTGDGYIDVNNALRHGDYDISPDTEYAAQEWAAGNGWTKIEMDEFRFDMESDFMRSTVDNLDSAIAKAKAPEPMVLYRGWGAGSGVADVKVGGTFEDNGFVSTSLSLPFVQKHFDQADVPIARIHIPKGAPAAFVGARKFGMTDEAEVLLGSGHTFKVLGRTDEFVDLEVVTFGES